MNQRIRAIVQMLHTSTTPLRLSDLAEQFQVSQRTIRNDLKEIDSLLLEQGLGKLSIGSKGKIQLPERFESIITAISPKDFYAYKLSRDERIQVAAAMLVSASGYVTLADIAEALLVSRAAVINDPDRIRAFVEQGGLEVLSRANKGLYIRQNSFEKDAVKIQMITRRFKTIGEERPGDIVQKDTPALCQNVLHFAYEG